ncbi:MAG: endonuclease/exonuclease/phosphatase family protein [Cocleimonas sp.]
MKIISWNLNGLEDRYLDERTEAAMFQILLGAPIEAVMSEGFKPNSPDIVVLQEVVERTYHAHIVPHFKAAGFSVFPPEPSERSYFEVVAVRCKKRSGKIDATYLPFEYSQQGRGLTMLKVNGLTVMTAHLESMKPGKAMRIDQAQFILNEMQKYDHCIFAGDTNLRTEEWDNLEYGNIKDAWNSVDSPEKHRTTWQYENRKSRFDRVWTHQLDILNFETFGKGNIVSTNERPSDHLGLRVEFNQLLLQK